MREHFEQVLRMRDHGGRPSPETLAAAEAALEHAPACPEPLEYLRDWLYELDRSRTAGMHGVDGFTYPMVESWARLTGRDPDPLEVEALMLLDAVMRHPDARRHEEDDEAEDDGND